MPLDSNADVDHLATFAVLAMRARRFNLIETACGLAAVSKVVVGDDAIARTMLARYLVELAAEIDPDAAVTVRWQ